MEAFERRHWSKQKRVEPGSRRDVKSAKEERDEPRENRLHS